MVTWVLPGDESERDSFDDMSLHVAPSGYFESTESQTSLSYSEMVSQGKPLASDWWEEYFVCVQQSHAVGAAVGIAVDGFAVGCADGAAVGAGTGMRVGWPGSGVGEYVGFGYGAAEGWPVGSWDGADVGSTHSQRTVKSTMPRTENAAPPAAENWGAVATTDTLGHDAASGPAWQPSSAIASPPSR